MLVVTADATSIRKPGEHAAAYENLFFYFFFSLFLFFSLFYIFILLSFFPSFLLSFFLPVSFSFTFCDGTPLTTSPTRSWQQASISPSGKATLSSGATASRSKNIGTDSAASRPTSRWPSASFPTSSSSWGQTPAAGTLQSCTRLSGKFLLFQVVPQANMRTLPTSSAELILKLARPILQRQAAAIEPQPEAEKEWCETIQGSLRKTVLTKACSSVRHPIQ